MKNLMETIYERRAVRKYTDAAIEKRIINQLIDAGRMALSGMNRQPWKFYVITDKDLIGQMDQQIAIIVRNVYRMPEMAKFLKVKIRFFIEPPVVIFITAPKANEWAALDIGSALKMSCLLRKCLA